MAGKPVCGQTVGNKREVWLRAKITGDLQCCNGWRGRAKRARQVRGSRWAGQLLLVLRYNLVPYFWKYLTPVGATLG